MRDVLAVPVEAAAVPVEAAAAAVDRSATDDVLIVMSVARVGTPTLEAAFRYFVTV